MGAFRVGTIVVNTSKPEWGPGKIIHMGADGRLHIVFRDLEDERAKKFSSGAQVIQVASSQSDPILDNLPLPIQKSGEWSLPKRRYSLDSLKTKFLREFPAGFSDPKFFKEERDYKLAAHTDFEQSLGLQNIRDLLESRDLRTLSTKASALLSSINLVSPYECAAFSDAMKVESAVEDFFGKLLRLLDSQQPERAVFEEYAEAVCSLPADRGRVATWPVATVFPYLARPDMHMYLKPEVTKQAAESLGFDLKYEPTPNWTTYDALLRMGRVYLDLLKPIGARDFLDVQTFIYVSCGGYDLLREKSKTAKTAKTSKAANAAGETVRIGYVNPNGQEVIRDTGERGSSGFARKYELKCRYCEKPYGANSFDIHERKCPNPDCSSGQNGKPGLTL